MKLYRPSGPELSLFPNSFLIAVLICSCVTGPSVLFTMCVCLGFSLSVSSIVFSYSIACFWVCITICKSLMLVCEQFFLIRYDFELFLVSIVSVINYIYLVYIHVRVLWAIFVKNCVACIPLLFRICFCYSFGPASSIIAASSLRLFLFLVFFCLLQWWWILTILYVT